MRKKHKIYQSPTVKIEPLPKAFVASVSVSNLQEQKARFLKHGKTPIFVVEGDRSTVEELTAKSSGKIRFDLLGEAEYILNTVKQKYGKGENYLEHIYGPRIEQNEANEILFDYIRENSLQESLAVYWSNDMPCSARMTWKGYSFKCNRPEARRYALWLNGTYENPYLRRHGLRCLLDHEIGTHFYRSYNDGFQPWFYDRKKFGLRSIGSFESLCTEEGLAAINTTLRAREKYLWLSALTYYTACKSTEMTFKQLFDHLGQFVDNPEQRWKHVMRVKRGLVDPNDLGGYGKDQCYFEGAVTVLRNIDDINFNLLMSGKICYDEVSRVKRMARLGSVCLPAIMRDMDGYRKQLKKMAVINGLHLSHPMHEPSRAYVERLKERQSGTRRKRKVRKGKKVRSSPSKVSGLQSQESKTSSEAGSRSDPSQPVDSEAGSDVSLQDHNSNTDVGSCGSSIKHSSSVTADYDSCTEPGLKAPARRGSIGHRDPECNHSNTHTTSGQLQVPIRIKNRPHTASGLPRCRLPPLHQTNSSDKLTGDSKENLFHMQDGTSAVWLGGLCNICGDSSSLDDLSHCGEELGAWLTCLPPSPPSPSPSVPPLSLPTLSQGEKSGVKGLASSAREKASHDSLTPNLQPRSAGRTGFSHAKPPLPHQS